MMIPNCEGISAPPESSLPLPPEREKDIISELLNKANADQKEGDVVCIIAERWWRDWKQYVGFESVGEHFTSSKNPNQVQRHSPRRPGKIDNSELVLDGEDEEGYELSLRMNLQELEDYNFVPLEVWNKLLEWYDGGPELPRKLICVRPAPKSLKVEVHPLRLHLINASNNSLRTITMSRKASVSELYNSICTLLKLDPAEVRVWDYFTRSKFKLLNEFDQNLEDANLLMDQEILLEVKVDGVWPSSSDMDITGSELALVPVEPSTSPISIAGGPNMSNGGFSTRFDTHFLQGNSFSFAGRSAGDTDDMLISGMKVVGRGLAGLNNLGNTCFMNSAVQCLVHTPPLVDFFLHDYTEEINKDNPLGMQGELAIAFGELLRKLWSSGRVPVAPREFKARLGRFAPQFSGYNQHDSQELLAFLLDGLHEDLNRVKNKPYIEANDPKGRTDEEFADECWQNHKARNDSIIVDVCQGQYKSTLVCPDCSKVSVTFDPFMYLSLPLPSTLTRKMTVTVFSSEGSHLPMPYTVTVPKNGCCKDLIQALCIECCLKSSESLLLAKANDHKIVRYLDYSFEPLSSIKDEEHLVAYKLPVNHDRLLRLEITHQRILLEPQENERPKLFGTPLLTCLAPDSKTEEDIQAVVGKVLAPLLRAKVCTPSQPKAVINKCGESSDCMVLTGDDACCEDSTSNMDLEDTTIGHPSFQLSLVDDKGVSNSPFDSGSMFLSGSCVKVLLDWSDRYLQLYNLSFLEDLPEVFKYGFMAKKTRQEAPSLFSCLEAFLKEEPLGPDDMWYCPNCKEHRQATKKLDLWRLPEILVVHLKRFSYNWILKNKLDTFVNYPLHNLDLSPYVKQSSASPKSHVYELYAVSNHYGGLGGGHYSAYAKLLDEDRWYHFDDNLVSPVSEDAIKTSAAYVLFYRRVGADSSMGVDELPKCSDSPSW